MLLKLGHTHIHSSLEIVLKSSLNKQYFASMMFNVITFMMESITEASYSH